MHNTDYYLYFGAGWTADQTVYGDNGIKYNPYSKKLFGLTRLDATNICLGNIYGTIKTVVAQTNITSVGELNGLTINGDLLFSPDQAQIKWKNTTGVKMDLFGNTTGTAPNKYTMDAIVYTIWF